MTHLTVDNGQVFCVFDDGARFPVKPAPVLQPESVTALEDGLIVATGTAIALARVERDYWRALAEKRGEELADLRAKGA